LTIHRIYVQVDGRVRVLLYSKTNNLTFVQTHDIIIGPEDTTQYTRPFHKYKNTIIGRYSNRIPVGKHNLTHPEDLSVTSSFIALPNESPKVSLHGGPIGFDALVFHQLDAPDKLTLFSATEKQVIVQGAIPSYALFEHVSPDGDQGFPGEMKVEVLIGLTGPSAAQVVGSQEEYDLGSLFLVYRAKVTGKDGKKIVSPINLTQVWSFLRCGEMV
jgi:aldose 1-epimerase